MSNSRTNTDQFLRRIFLFLFILSGFSGLIYQSIWTHYLKLFLGHASYAQTLVLAIFMGGMAIGSWVASSWTTRIARPLMAYAVTEAAVGVLALLFHGVFVVLTRWSYDVVIPGIGNPLLVEAWKWSLASLLILPQSILLGATFPFMTAGLLRRLTGDQGRMIAGLYFANSLGAAVGILIAGFMLIQHIGLPGTIMTAGIINILLALAVYVIVRSDKSPQPARVPTGNSQTGTQQIHFPVTILLVVSMLTGLASFMYEIGWIRMLSLVLGSSTHAFELMLSAFISGIAIGGFWVRKHIDTLANPLLSLSLIQIMMGTLAVATLVFYGQTFDAMQYALAALQKTDEGYTFFNIFSHSIALAMMLPATICAGMTLPIITHVLLKGNYGETAIGRVYATNTIGAIIGVFLAVQWIMPVFGLKALIIVGGLIDIGLGLWLLTITQSARRLTFNWLTSVAAVCFVVIVHVNTTLDVTQMAGGGFTTRGKLHEGDEVIFHHDGKTATVDVVKHKNSYSIRTNGKADASVLYSEESFVSDEATMANAIAIPLMVRPSIKTAAIIGMGSGMSTDSLLKYPGVSHVDTIEIEPGMVEGAKLLGPKVALTFSDPRNTIHIADAKTFFTNHQRTYDLIMSEPSNPWVSGVAGLFSEEFYRRTASHLNEDGIFAQWFHVYEMDMNLVASVEQALKKTFPHYQLYSTTYGDVLFLASKKILPPANIQHLAGTELEKRINTLGLKTQADIDWMYVGNEIFLGPLFSSFGIPANSDFFPYLDQHAVRARFMGLHAIDLAERVPFAVQSLDRTFSLPVSIPNPDHPLGQGKAAAEAHTIIRFWQQLENNEGITPGSEPRFDISAIQTVRSPLYDPRASCNLTTAKSLWLPSLLSLYSATRPYLPLQDTHLMLSRLIDTPCLQTWPQEYRLWIELLLADTRGDTQSAIETGTQLLPPAASAIHPSPINNILMQILMNAYIDEGRFKDTLALWGRYAEQSAPPLDLRTLVAYAASQNQPAGGQTTHGVVP